MIEKMNFPYNDNIVVVNRTQYMEHYKLYEGYIKKYNEIQAIMESGNAKPEESNSIYSKFRCLKRGQSFSLDAIILHELYFSNIGGAENVMSEYLESLLKKEFGRAEVWYEDFVATAKASRGWAILAFDQRTKSLINISLDSHDEGVIVYSFPILVLDVYEHAYFMQYGTDKVSYIYNFMNNINWKMIDKRLNSLGCY